MATISRRGFLLAAAGAAGAVLGGRRPAWASAAVTDLPGLSPRRAATMRGLVATLRHAPGGRFAAVDARAAEARLTRWYARQDADERRRADAVLDAVEGCSRRGYDALARTAASCRSPRAARRAAALSAAVDLAAVVCEPPPAEDERPPVMALEVRG
jgi:hypothetical protein